MDGLQVILTSAVVAALVGPIATFMSQRRLAERQARIDYELIARTRLYEAIGPLRFQLLVATRDVMRRVSAHHLSKWNMDVEAYYAKSFIYRILRPLAIGELVERQMNFADFSVDSDAVSLLRFQTAAYRMLVGEDPVEGHPGLDWTTQSQHVFRDNLRAAAANLVTRDSEGREYVVDYSQFAAQFLDPREDGSLEPLAMLFDHCNVSLTENPIFWTRVVGYAYVCRWLLTTVGSNLGFGDRELDVEGMLGATEDQHIASQAGSARSRFDRVIGEDL